MEILLGVASDDAASGSRLAGTPPAIFADDPVLTSHDYVLTLAADTAPWLGGREVSVFVRRGFGIGDPDDCYPDIAVSAVLHAPSSRADTDSAIHPFLASRALETVTTDTHAQSLIRIAEEPHRIQDEESFLEPVRDAGFTFLFTFDEEGLPIDDEVVSEYQFGYGAVHFFGRLDAAGIATEIVAGLIENS
ncbi:hypothetical protein KZC52_08640 [Microbacterium sp. kSW2-24]|uniref:hypothetical protein n=1 Tax=Microbacterium galbinum TaxID=2851646 RepID=UPI001FFC5AD0|nr:hypothetical protein [Microbacterium galbinum]MCK2022986.1 hypothetical protein [Microbacterium galbinum]